MSTERKLQSTVDQQLTLHYTLMKKTIVIRVRTALFSILLIPLLNEPPTSGSYIGDVYRAMAITVRRIFNKRNEKSKITFLSDRSIFQAYN